MSVVDDYLKTVAEPDLTTLTHICEVVRRAVPNATEVMSYGLPTFKYKGKMVLGFAANRNFMSIYPSSGPIAELADRLKAFETTKGSIHFTHDHPLPDDIIEAFIESRVTAIDSVLKNS